MVDSTYEEEFDVDLCNLASRAGWSYPSQNDTMWQVRRITTIVKMNDLEIIFGLPDWDLCIWSHASCLFDVPCDWAEGVQAVFRIVVWGHFAVERREHHNSLLVFLQLLAVLCFDRLVVNIDSGRSKIFYKSLSALFDIARARKKYLCDKSYLA